MSKNIQVTFDTEFGQIILELYPQNAPITVNNFLKYVDENRYNDFHFYRVVHLNNQDLNNIKIEVIGNTSTATLLDHDLSNGDVGIVSISNLPVRGNSFTTVTILFTQLSSTPVGKGNTLPKNGIGTNVYLDGGFTGFTTRGRVASGSTVTLSTTASDLDIVTLGVHYNGSGTAGKENFKVYVSGDTGYRIGND